MIAKLFVIKLGWKKRVKHQKKQWIKEFDEIHCEIAVKKWKIMC